MTPESQPLSDEAQELHHRWHDEWDTLCDPECPLPMKLAAIEAAAVKRGMTTTGWNTAAIEAPFRERIAELESALRAADQAHIDAHGESCDCDLAPTLDRLGVLANTKDPATPQREPLSVERLAKALHDASVGCNFYPQGHDEPHTPQAEDILALAAITEQEAKDPAVRLDGERYRDALETLWHAAIEMRGDECAGINWGCNSVQAFDAALNGVAEAAALIENSSTESSLAPGVEK